MPETKSFCTYEQQLQILKRRGLSIADDALALQWLREKNYYRLSAYSLTLRHKSPSTGEDEFLKDSSFSTIIDLYQFDEQFRAAISHAAAIAETNLKAYIAYYHARQYGPVGYLDGNHFEDPWRHAKLLNGLSKSLGLRKDEPFVLHHHKDLNDVYPVWVIVEVLTFDQVSMMYRNLLPEDRAAHGSRFYHRQRVNPPARLPKSINSYGTKPYGYVYALWHLLPIPDRSAFVNAVHDCFIAHPSAQLSELGFPDNWLDILTVH